MDEWPAPDTAQPQGWLPPESQRLPLPESPARHASPDGLPEYSQPLAYSQPGAYSHPGPYSAPPLQGKQPTYNRPTAYGQPAYARPSGYPGAGGAPWVPAPPRRRSRLKLLVILAVALVAGLVAVAVLIPVYQQYRLDAGATGHTLTLPKSTGPYVRITTGTANRLGTDLAEQVKSTGSGVLWTKPLVGIYGKSAASAPAAVFIGGDGASNPRLRAALRKSSPRLFIDGFMAGAQVPESTDFPAGKFGGVLRCGSLTTTETACVWVDKSTVGTLVLIGSQSLAQAASTALAFRNAAEH